MAIAQKFIYTTFIALLVATLTHNECVADGGIAASAADVSPVQPGETVPGFTVRTVEDEPYVFDPGRLERPVILVTFRGGWCPYCNMHLSELSRVVPEIQGKGIDVLFLSGDRPELLYSSLKRETREDIEGLGYTILSDANVEAARALGIAFRAEDATIERYESRGTDIAGSSMKNAHALPVPAVFVIDTDGRITFSFVEADYKIRLPADRLLAAAMELVD
jgi:peroxiredoxin